MRLINTTTYELDWHVNPPPYAILSHTWRQGEEISCVEFVAKQGKAKAGYTKIDHLCSQAFEDGLKYAWIDTACIDKSNNSELSEAINSMFLWYREAKVCYVYLDDTCDVNSIGSSRWITRGWTLQELLAPSNVYFFSQDWSLLGTKASLVDRLVRWTRIDRAALENSARISKFSAATRISWAALRHTTRVEDSAYCLLGIFGICMPLIYGERSNAFVRLQEEILRQHSDLSILAYDRLNLSSFGNRLLAPGPHVFGMRPKVLNTGFDSFCKMTGRGLEVDLGLVQVADDQYLGILPCRFEFDLKHCIALRFRKTHLGNNVHWLLEYDKLAVVPYIKQNHTASQRLLLRNTPSTFEDRRTRFEFRHICCLHATSLTRHGYEVLYAGPQFGTGGWNMDTMTSEIVPSNMDTHARKFGFVHWSHHEAFIITVVNVNNRQNGTNLLLKGTSKPKGVDCVTWLEREGIYSPAAWQSKSLAKHPRPHVSERDHPLKRAEQPFLEGAHTRVWEEEAQAKDNVKDISGGIRDRDTWDLAGDHKWTPHKLKTFNSLRLESNSCFSEVALRVNVLENQDEKAWEICVEPNGMSHPTRLEKRRVPKRGDSDEERSVDQWNLVDELPCWCL